MYKPKNKAAVAAIVAAAGAAIFTGGAGAQAAGLIGSPQIRNDSIRSVDIQDGTIAARDLRPGLITRIDGKDGVNGKDGVDGARGPKGDKGDPATVGISHWSEGGTVPAANKPYAQADPTDPTYMPGYVEVEADCQAPGQYAIAGGYTAGTYKGGVEVTLNKNTAGAPGTDAYGKGWIVGYTNLTDKPQTVRTWVVCATVVEAEPTS